MNWAKNKHLYIFAHKHYLAKPLARLYVGIHWLTPLFVTITINTKSFADSFNIVTQYAMQI